MHVDWVTCILTGFNQFCTHVCPLKDRGPFVSGDLQQVHAVHGQCVLIKETRINIFLVSKCYFTFLGPHPPQELNLSLHNIFPNLICHVHLESFFFFFFSSVILLVALSILLISYISVSIKEIYFYPQYCVGLVLVWRNLACGLCDCKVSFLEHMVIEIFVGLQTN